MNNALTLWEDTDLTEQWKKSESKLTFAPSDGINETNSVSVGSVCENTGNKKKWIRNCPKCKKILVYNHEISFYKAIQLNSICRSCAAADKNFVGKRFGKITVTNQYVGKRNKTFVDYKCDCGKEVTEKLLANVKLQASCSICQYRGKHNKEYGWASFIQVYNGYKGNAKHGRSGVREFLLSKEDAMKLFKGNCFYCGSPPSKIRKNKRYYGEFVYNGIDRKDNTRGYTLDNCVSCCEFCNMTKNDTPFEDFIGWIRKVYNNTQNVKGQE